MAWGQRTCYIGCARAARLSSFSWTVDRRHKYVSTAVTAARMNSPPCMVGLPVHGRGTAVDHAAGDYSPTTMQPQKNLDKTWLWMELGRSCGLVGARVRLALLRLLFAL